MARFNENTPIFINVTVNIIIIIIIIIIKVIINQALRHEKT